ncbi:hypothetical protein TRVL_05766 [Trypanosoma vivax]|nr:hypothetical protein TRVL_05766 [Trypanosoma vivax]
MRWQHTGYACAPRLLRVAVTSLCLSSRRVSTAPPLSLLSWSVDGTGNAHRDCRRRLTMQERLPLIRRTILDAAPDIVALQDSSPEVAETLCATSSLASSPTCGGCVPNCAQAGGANPSDINRDANCSEASSGVADAVPRYELIGVARNGKCGYMQLFRRSDSVWRGCLVPTSPSLTAEFVSTSGATSGRAADEVGTITRGAEVRFVLTNVDLSYRGKSLGLDGKPIVTPGVSVDGSPFTLSLARGVAGDTRGAKQNYNNNNQRLRAQLDPHRDMALSFVSQVAEPDVLLGSFFMGQSETMPDYADAWVLAGAPTEHERTTNTFAKHKYDKETNFFYFVRERACRGVDVAEATADISESLSFKVGPDVQVGTPVPLDAKRIGVAAEDKPAASDNTTPRNDSSRSGQRPASLHQVAGRFQRCFFRNISSKHHKHQYPFVRRYTRRQLLVLKPFTEISLTAAEAQYYGGIDKRRLRCSASDTYPVLVLLS